MKTIPDTFKGKGEVKGVTFTKVKENDNAFIYSRSDGYFEVFKKVENIRFDCISYPKSGSFGIWAWCFSNLKDAEQKFAELSQPKNAKIASIDSQFINEEII